MSGNEGALGQRGPSGSTVRFANLSLLVYLDSVHISRMLYKWKKSVKTFSMHLLPFYMPFIVCELCLESKEGCTFEPAGLLQSVGMPCIYKLLLQPLKGTYVGFC